jgi:hypothetical protein
MRFRKVRAQQSAPTAVALGGAPRFLDSVDRQLLWSSVGEKAAQIGERGSVPEG